MKVTEKLKEILFEDLRIDEVIFDELDKSKLIELCDLYSSKTLRILKKYFLQIVAISLAIALLGGYYISTTP